MYLVTRLAPNFHPAVVPDADAGCKGREMASTARRSVFLLLWWYHQGSSQHEPVEAGNRNVSYLGREVRPYGTKDHQSYKLIRSYKLCGNVAMCIKIVLFVTQLVRWKPMQFLEGAQLFTRCHVVGLSDYILMISPCLLVKPFKPVTVKPTIFASKSSAIPTLQHHSKPWTRFGARMETTGAAKRP